MNRQRKQEERAAYYALKAEQARKDSNEAYQKSHDLVENIPVGQPITGSYQRRKRHLHVLESSWNALGNSVKLNDKADYYENKRKAAERNTAVYLGDDDAVERLQQKIESLERIQENMKAVNKIVRSKKLTDEQKITQVQELVVSREKATELVCVPNCFGELGFASYKIINNSAMIRDAKKRLERAKELKNTEVKEYEIGGVKIVENAPENRLQLFFNGKPDENVRKALKANGFRWAYTIGAWQSSFKKYYLDRAKEIINKMN